MSFTVEQKAAHIAAKNNLYPATFDKLVQQTLETTTDPRYKSVAIQTQYIMQHGKAMTRTQIKKLKQKLGIA